MAKLTVLKLKTTRPGRHGDGGGLFLVVRPAGSRSWVLRVQVAGRRRDYGLGGLDVLGLAEAREKAAQWRKLAKLGIDPAAAARKERRSPLTFAHVAQLYHANVKDGWKNHKHAAQWLTSLKAYAYPLLGQRLVSEIDAADIWAALQPIWQEKPETARRVRQRIATVLDYSKANAWRDTEAPMRALAKIASKQRVRAGNFAAMPYAQLPALMARLRSEEQTVGRQALQLTLLTAARSGEVRGARWREIDLVGREWTVPAERMKTGREHKVPLSEPAIALLKACASLHGKTDDGLIFPGLRGGPISDMTMAKAFHVAGGDGYTVHGSVRSGFRDWVAEKCPRIPGEVAEAALAHSLGKVEAAYRRATYFDQRRKLMTAWANYLGRDQPRLRAAGRSTLHVR